MCRFAAWVGPAAPLATLLYEAPRSLEVQAYAPREMVSGHVNVDGTGVAWWAGGDPEPLRYVGERPPWSDANLPDLSRRLQGSPMLAVVRSATQGIPAGPAAMHPFVHGGLAGTHNGYLRAFAERTAWPLLDELPVALRGRLETLSDSLLLFLHVVARTPAATGKCLAGAVADVVRRAAEICEAAAVDASLNLVVASLDEVVAVRTALGVASNSLYVLEAGRRWPSARLLAAEPLDDDPGWVMVPDGHLVEVRADGIDLRPLDGIA